MKRNLIYLLPVLLAFFAGCSSKPKVQPSPPAPNGTFKGLFTLYHYHVPTGKFDTVNAIVNLSIDASTGIFAITGDTAVIHGGSFGTYTFGYGSDIIFTDKTLLSTPTKQHLNGDYLYNYNGYAFNLLKIVGDTLSYHYNFLKN